MQSPRFTVCALAVSLALSWVGQAATTGKSASRPVKAVPVAITAPVISLQAGPSAAGISEFRLPNGLRILLAPDQTEPATSVLVAYGVGSRDESPGEYGMAHVLEHMMFKGSKRFGDERAEYQRRGIGWNAYTTVDNTVYSNGFVSNDETLAWLLAHEADRMTGALLQPEALATEMTVVRNEWERGENNNSQVLNQRMLAAAYIAHPYHHSTIGYRSDIEHVDIDRLRQFYQRFYRPDNATLTIAGKFDVDAAKQAIVREFGTLQNPPLPLVRAVRVEPVQDGQRIVELRRPGDAEHVRVAYRIPGCDHPDTLALRNLAALLSNTRNGRLQSALVETKQAVSQSASVQCMEQDGLFVAAATVPKGGDMAKLERALIDQLEGLDKAPFQASAFEMVQLGTANAVKQMRNKIGTLANLATQLANHTDWRYALYNLDRAETISLAEVNQVGPRYFKASARIVGRFLPTAEADRAEIPVVPDTAALVRDYQRTAMESGEVIEPTAAAVEARTVRGQLANGLKYALLAKKTKGNEIQGLFRVRFGSPEERRLNRMPGDFAGDLLNKGTEKLDKLALENAFNRLDAAANFNSSSGGVQINFKARHDQIADAVALFSEVVRHPRFDGVEFDLLKRRWLDSLGRDKAPEPELFANSRLTQHFDMGLPADSVLRSLTRRERFALVSATTLDMARRFHGEYYGGSEGEIVLVGDFDVAAVQKALEQGFGNWPAKKPYVKAQDPYREIAPVRFVTETPDTKNAIYQAQAYLPLAYSFHDDMVLTMANQLLGRGPQSRLWQRVREKDGLTYGIGSSLSFDRDDEYATWSISATFAPENRAKIEAAILEEINRARRDGFTAEEFAREKEGVLRGYRQTLAFDTARMRLLADSLRYGEPLSLTEAHIRDLEQLTLEEVNAAFKRHFDPAKLSYSLAGDFAKAEGKPAGDDPRKIELY
ncbi:pitrilysin family protein [Chitinimonas sp.]|uniref:M16 family metallopeptidase n=1 Tax=Chitinimonas sp. TaxID=1934313 RepID=UPI002F9551F3